MGGAADALRRRPGLGHALSVCVLQRRMRTLQVRLETHRGILRAPGLLPLHNYPGSDVYECVPVFSDMGMRGQIVDDEAMAEQENLKEAIKRGFNLLADYYTTKDGPAIVQLLQDPLEPARVRLKAAEMIGDIGESEAIEPMRNMRFPNEILHKKVEEAIAKIHERYFTRECPFCAEIIKRRASVCKHCGKEVAGK